ncbi:conserved Plasmodium protein, unknown function [Plasmodium ovale wallikeri]|uniref:Uncharacterized protein n=2 Tax=Plasmodium ovale TaxID=36330 RepID=A0A1A8ZP90_PLAOA|nr:conserved Plasmodium protein, unknown function [Plasmodium ovale wallikeri]SBT45678.1 conserved Plasmodium protein, unknown function [Plasmodium ovale wallikeri]
MKDIAFFFLPMGIALSVLLLSGVAMFQSLAISAQKRSINFQMYSYKINVSISSIISLYALLRLSLTILELKYNQVRENYESSNLQHINSSYLKKIRLQRNFWILLLCSIAWIFYIRFTYLLLYYREKVKKSDEEYEKWMEENRHNKKMNSLSSQSNIEQLQNVYQVNDNAKLLTHKWDTSDATTDENEDTKEKSSVLAGENKKKANIRQRR